MQKCNAIHLKAHQDVSQPRRTWVGRHIKDVSFYWKTIQNIDQGSPETLGIPNLSSVLVFLVTKITVQFITPTLNITFLPETINFRLQFNIQVPFHHFHFQYYVLIKKTSQV